MSGEYFDGMGADVTAKVNGHLARVGDMLNSYMAENKVLKAELKAKDDKILELEKKLEKIKVKEDKNYGTAKQGQPTAIHAPQD